MGWERFVRDHGIPHRRGSGGTNVEIKCPFCGSMDRSMHMGLHLESPRWGCWRNRGEHSGGHPAKLISALLNVSKDEARVLTKAYFDLSDIAESSRRCLRGALEVEPLNVPAEFQKFRPIQEPYERMLQGAFLKYLRTRHFDPEFICPRFDLRWCVSGPYANRLIVPVKYRNTDKWITWLGRAIDGNPLRYKIPKEKEIKSVISNFVFDEANLTGGTALIVAEGVFDSMSVTSCALAGVHGTALFGKNLSSYQINTLMTVSQRYEVVLLALDSTAYDDTLKFYNQLSWFIPNLRTLRPQSAKDFNEMSRQQLASEIKSALQQIRSER